MSMFHYWQWTKAAIFLKCILCCWSGGFMFALIWWTCWQSKFITKKWKDVSFSSFACSWSEWPDRCNRTRERLPSMPHSKYSIHWDGSTTIPTCSWRELLCANLLTEQIPTPIAGKSKAWSRLDSDDDSDDDPDDSGYYGGIWQVDQIAFKNSQDSNSHPSLATKFKQLNDQLNIDWKTTSWNQCVKSLYSALAARINLFTIPASIPTTLDGQANYWKTYYNTGSGKGTVSYFIDCCKSGGLGDA